MRQKTWKRRLALALAAAMTLNMGMLTSFAKWEQVGSDWYFTDDQTGEQVKGKVRKIHGEWYSFDEDGVMETDKRIDLDGAAFYITPGGEFAVNKWMFLDDEGHKCTHVGGCDCKWYRFGNVVKESGSPFSGGMVKDGLVKIEDSWYSFDPDTGIMRSDQLVRGVSKDRPKEIFYASENGDLFKGWMQLTEEGHRAKDDNDEISWYFFKDPETGRGMARDDEVKNQGKWYVFDEDGHMIFNTWYHSLETEGEYYYQYAGDRAVNKCLYLDDTWYRFDDTGVATTSNAQRKRVETVKPLDEDKTVTTEVGKEVTLRFQLTEPEEDKASTSNAMKEFTNDHDIWIKDGKIKGRFLRNKVTISPTGVCTITYVSDKVNESGDTFFLCVDGVAATEEVTVITVMPTDEKGDEISQEELTIKNIIEAETFEPGEEKEAVEQLTKIYDGFDDDKKDDFEKQWMEKPDQFEKLEKAYAESQRITVKETTVPEDLSEKLDGEVSVAGAAFNAPANSTVELKVQAPKDEDYSVSEKLQVAFDISLLIDDKATTEVLRMPVVVTMPVPKAFAGKGREELKAKMKLYNFHGDDRIEVKFDVNVKGQVSFLTDRFSTYVFALDETATTDRPIISNGGSSSGGSSSSSSRIAGTLAGQWMLDEIGWWFRLSDGSYAVNSWQYLAYNGTARWYRFDEKGYICKGWFTDTDGHRYYLNPVSDGLMGAMLTGWQQIDGIWYYFNTVSDGTQGALLVNTTTPDGYSVDANGQWIQQ